VLKRLCAIESELIESVGKQKFYHKPRRSTAFELALAFPPDPRYNFRMIVTTGNGVDGREVAEYLGVVRGIVVRATGIGRGFIGGLKSIAGGNIEEITVVCEEARMEAFNRMVRHAHEIHADAVIGMRYDATEFGQGGTTEVLSYGTAVKLK
jgi:uncharacterized protein YbjQ (UPF0145 family)